MKIKQKKKKWEEGVGSGWGVRVDVNKELKFLGKFKKKNWGGGGVWVRGRGGGGVWVRGGGGGGGGQDGCELRIENFVKSQKKNYFFFLGGGGPEGGGGVWLGGGVVRMDVNEELKFL